MSLIMRSITKEEINEINHWIDEFEAKVNHEKRPLLKRIDDFKGIVDEEGFYYYKDYLKTCLIETGMDCDEDERVDDFERLHVLHTRTELMSLLRGIYPDNEPSGIAIISWAKENWVRLVDPNETLDRLRLWNMIVLKADWKPLQCVDGMTFEDLPTEYRSVLNSFEDFMTFLAEERFVEDRGSILQLSEESLAIPVLWRKITRHEIDQINRWINKFETRINHEDRPLLKRFEYFDGLVEDFGMRALKTSLLIPFVQQANVYDNWTDEMVIHNDCDRLNFRLSQAQVTKYLDEVLPDNEHKRSILSWISENWDHFSDPNAIFDRLRLLNIIVMRADLAPSLKCVDETRFEEMPARYRAALNFFEYLMTMGVEEAIEQFRRDHEESKSISSLSTCRAIVSKSELSESIDCNESISHSSTCKQILSMSELRDSIDCEDSISHSSTCREILSRMELREMIDSDEMMSEDKDDKEMKMIEE